ncbi:MAG: ESPR-type extended signal peptide-containing protein, partial [Alysiella sp.]|uniref:ESPR-type extended signal peptide-containing protein n=1 Tax=Alysiella sp. TaxID=1872483 RepID=UPI0026DB0C8F
MNHSYRVVYNETTNTYTAVAEIAKARGKKSQSSKAAAVIAVMGVMAVGNAYAATGDPVDVTRHGANHAGKVINNGAGSTLLLGVGASVGYETDRNALPATSNVVIGHNSKVGVTTRGTVIHGGTFEGGPSPALHIHYGNLFNGLGNAGLNKEGGHGVLGRHVFLIGEEKLHDVSRDSGTEGGLKSSSVAIGARAQTGGGGEVAIGDAAIARASRERSLGVAIGANAYSEAGAVALGSSTFGYGRNGIVMGRQASMIGDAGLALGAVSASVGNYSIAMGHSATALGQGAIALGNSNSDEKYDVTTHTRTEGKNAIAMGVKARVGDSVRQSDVERRADESIEQWRERIKTALEAVQGKTEDAIAIGTNTNVTNKQSIAIGSGSQVSGEQSIAIGVGNKVTGNNAGAIGDPSLVEGNASYTYGNDNAVGSNSSNVFGYGSNNQFGATATYDASGKLQVASGLTNTASANNSAAVGSNNYINSENTLVLGNGINTVVENGARKPIGNTVANSVYLGNDSTARADAGKNYKDEAQPTGGYAEGATTTAGATGQVENATVGGLEYGKVKIADERKDPVTGAVITPAKYSTFAGSTAAGAVTVGAAGAERRIMNVAAGEISATSTDAINGSQLYYALNQSQTYFHVNPSGEKADATGSNNEAAVGSVGSATGAKSLTAGFNASSTGRTGVAIGTNATVNNNGGIAIGENAKSQTALGNEDATSSGAKIKAIAIGAGSEALDDKAIALGDVAKAHGDHSMAMGAAAEAKGTYATAIGSTAKAAGNSSTVIGQSAESTASGSNGVAVGIKSTVAGNRASAIGYASNASGSQSLALGSEAKASNTHAIAAGTSANAAGVSSIAMGQNAKAGSNGINNAIAIGTNANATTSVSGVALGHNSVVESNNALALGVGSKVATNLPNAVALGAYSEARAGVSTNSATVGGITYSGFAGNSVQQGTGTSATPSRVVSVGTVGSERQIQNVAAGQITDTSTDAINGSQLYMVAKGLREAMPVVYTDASGNPVVQHTDGKYYKPSDIVNGAPVTGATAVEPKDVIASMNSGVTPGSTTTPMALKNVGSNLTPTTSSTTLIGKDGTTSTVTNPTKSASITPADAKAINNNAATVGDVLNAGWNLKTADKRDLDFVRPYDTVNFVNGNGTSVTSSTDGAESKIQYNVAVDNSTTFITGKDSTNQTVYQHSDGKWYTKPNGEGTVVNETISNTYVSAKPAAETGSIQYNDGNASNTKNTSTVDAGKVAPKSGDANKVATVENVAEAINAAGFKVSANGTETADGVVNAGDSLNFKNGTNTTVAVSGNTVTVNVVANGTLTPAQSSGSPTGKIEVPTGTDATKLVDAKTVAEAINNSGFKLLTNDNTNGITGENALLKTGETLNLNKGRNISIKQIADGFEVATQDEVNFNKVTVGDATNGIQITSTPATSGSPTNTISKLTGNLAPTNSNGTQYDIHGTASTGVTKTTVQAAPTNVAAINNNAATVGDVLNAGWNLQQNGTAKDFVRPYDTVDFANGSNTEVAIDTDGERNTIKVNVVANGTIEKAKDGSGKDTGAVAVPATAGSDTKLVDAKTVADAINNSGFKLTASAGTGGTEEAGGIDEELINPADTVEIIAGKNLSVKQENNGKVTLATQDDVTFKTVSITDGSNPSTQVVSTANGISFATTTPAAGGGTPTTKDTVITGVTSGLPTYGASDGNKNGLVNLNPASGSPTDNTVATVGDLRNMGFVVSSDKTTSTTVGSPTATPFNNQVKNAGEVKFVGTGVAKVSGATDSSGVNTITVHVDPAAAIENTTLQVADSSTTGTPAGKVIAPETTAPAGSPAGTTPAANKYVQAGDLANALNQTGFTVKQNGNASSTPANDLINAGDSVNFVDGTGTTAKVTTDANGATVQFNVNKATAPTVGTDGKVGAPTGTGDQFLTATDTIDAINKAGFTVVANDTGAAGDALINAGDKLNFKNGTNTTVAVSGNAVTVNVVANGTLTPAQSSGSPTGKIEVPTGTDATKLVDAKTVAEAINNSGFKLLTNDNTNGITGENALLKTGETLNLNKGRNISIKQIADGFEVATQDEVNFNKVTVGDATNGIQITSTPATSGSPTNTISKLTGNLAPTNSNGTQYDIHGTASTGVTKTTVQAAPTNVAAINNNAATVGDVLNAGWNLQHTDAAGTTTNKDFVRAYDSVAFQDGRGAKVIINSTGTGNTIKIDTPINYVNNAGAETSTPTNTVKLFGDASGSPVQITNAASGVRGKSGVADGSGDPATATARSDADKAKIADAIAAAKGTDLNNAANIGDVQAAMNQTAANVGFGLMTDGVIDAALTSEDKRLANGETFNLNQGDNIVIEQIGNGFKVGTAKDVTFDTVKVNDGTGKGNLTVGDNAKGITITSTPTASGNPTNTISNLTANLPSVNDNTKVITNPDGTTVAAAPENITKAPLTATQAAAIANDPAKASNAATIGDVLNAGWNLQNNGTAADFVKPFDTVNFKNGGNTQVVINNTDGTSNDISINVVGLPVAYTTELGVPVAKVGDDYYEIGADGKPDTTKRVTDPSKLVSNMINPTAAPNEIGNATVLGNVAQGAKTFAAPTNAAGDNLALANDGKWYKADEVAANGTPTTGATAQTPSGSPAKGGLIDFANSNPTNALTVADARNMGWVVSSDKTTGDLGNAYSDQVRNTNEVKFVGTNGATVSGKTDANGVRVITVDVQAQNVANNAQLPVVYTHKDGDKVVKANDGNFYKAGNVDASGNPIVTGGVAPTKVEAADIIASINNGNNEAKNAPTTLANVQGTLNRIDNNGDVKDPLGQAVPAITTGQTAAPNSATEIANMRGNPSVLNRAATVGDVLNSGFNLQGNGTAKDFVRHGDTLNFVDGGNTAVNVETTADGLTSKISVNVVGLPVGYVTPAGDVVAKVGDYYYKVDADGKPDMTQRLDPAEVKDLVANVINPDTTAGTSGSPTTLGNVKGNLAVIDDAAKTATNIDGTPAAGSNSSFVSPDTVANANKNNAATVGDVLNAGWNLKANGTATDFVRHTDTVDFVNGNGATVTISNTNGNANTIRIDTPMAYADNTGAIKDSSGKPLTPTNAVQLVGADADKAVSLGNVSSGVASTSTVADGKAGDPARSDADKAKIADAIAAATGTALNNAANIGDVQAAVSKAVATATTTVGSQDGSITVTPSTNSAGGKHFDVKVATTQLDIGNGTKLDPITGTAAPSGSVLNPAATDAGKFVKAGDLATTLNNMGFNVTSAGNKGTGTQSVELVKAGNTVTYTGGKNINVVQNGTNFTFETKDDVAFTTVTTGNTKLDTNGITISNPADPSKNVSLTNNGLNNGGNKITNVAEGSADTDAVNVKQLKDYVSGNSGFVINADKQGTGIAATGDKVAANETVNFTGAADASGHKNIVTTVKDNEISFGLNKEIKVGDNTTGGTVNVGGSNGITITSTPATSGSPITNTISNLTGNLKPVTAADNAQPTDNSPANLASKLNNAATVGDVLNAGWNLQGNGTAVDTVTHNDTVNFINGRGAKVTVAKDATTGANTIKVDTPIGYIDPTRTGSPESTTSTNTVKLFGDVSGSPVQVTNVASGVRNPDGSMPSNRSDAIKNADGDTLNNAANIGDLQAVQGNVTSVVNQITELVGTIKPVDPSDPTKGNVATTNNGTKLQTFNVHGQDEQYHTNLIEAINTVSAQGTKYFHTNDGQTFNRNVHNGVDSSAVGQYSTAIGREAVSEGNTSLAIGYKAAAGQENAIAIGNTAKAQENAVAMGNQAQATGKQSIAIGDGAQATGLQSISIGTGNVVTGKGSIAIGDPSYIAGAETASTGNDNLASTKANNAQIFGNKNKLATNDATLTVVGSAENVGAFGNNNTILSDNVRIVGSNNSVGTNAANTMILGNNVTIADDIANATALGNATSVTVENGV